MAGKVEHFYLQPFLTKGKCKKQLKDGTFCESEFTGPRSQKYCADHRQENDKNRNKLSQNRLAARRRKGDYSPKTTHPQV
jgi:hypothetical protein